MVVLPSFNRGFILIQLLSLLPDPSLTYPPSLESATYQIIYLNDIIQNVLKERPADTLLLLRRRQDLDCILKEFQPQHPIPTLRLDESTIINVKTLFNSEAISLVCLSELADLKLLTALARNLHRMRETRIIIWLQSVESNLKPFLDIITNQASNYNFVSLIVLHSNLSDVKGSIVAYQLQPFPRPSVVRIRDLLNGTIFPNFWRNFRNKTAVAIPSLYPPASFLSKDRKSGRNALSGIMDKLVMEFARKHNIHLRIKLPRDTMDGMNDNEIRDLISSGQIDLSMHNRVWTSNVECTSALGISKLFIVVPCGEEWGIGDVYKGLRTFFTLILGVYIVFAIVETLFMALTCWKLDQIFRFNFFSLFMNLSAFKGVLGLSIDLRGNRGSISLHQIIMLMSIFSLIVNCFFNANLSTLLTKRPQNNQISNFQELRNSELPVVFDSMFRGLLDRVNIPKHQAVFVSNKERMQMMLSRNSSNAYLMFLEMWNVLEKYQTHSNRKVLCEPSGLIIFGYWPLHGILKQDSVYIQAIDDFIQWSIALGLKKHWDMEAYDEMETYTNHSHTNPHPTPLTLAHLQWVWKLIGLCYAVSTMALIGELCLGYWQKRRVPRHILVI